MKCLIYAGADVNAPDEVRMLSDFCFLSLIFFLTKGSWTPMHFGALVGNSEILELLLTTGADANRADKVKCAFAC